MRGRGLIASLLALAVAGGAGPAVAEPGSFFKDLFNGGGNGAPSLSAPRAQDPGEAYCPPVAIGPESAVIQSYAGSAGDSARLRYQIKFGQLSRECTAREGGSVAVKVGVEVRALLGPAGTPGKFEAPLAIMIKYDDKVVETRARRLAVSVPAGAVQGSAAIVEADLVVPAAMAVGYDIEVALGGRAAARPKAPARTAAKRRKPAGEEATAVEGEQNPAQQ